MLEPAFCDPVITHEKSFASYHDAALNLAAEMAEVLEAEVNSIRQENRLSPEQMCRTASQVPHENLGTEGVYWLRLYSVYEEYRAGMMSEAANMPSGGRGVDEVAIEITATDDQLTTEDGPISNRRWQFGGAVLPGQMTRQEHRLASYLFQFTDKRDVSFSELINNGIVGSDVDRTDDQTIAKHGRNVTKWFRERNVPLKVSSTTVDRMMTLSTISTDGR